MTKNDRFSRSFFTKTLVFGPFENLKSRICEKKILSYDRSFAGDSSKGVIPSGRTGVELGKAARLKGLRKG